MGMGSAVGIIRTYKIDNNFFEKLSKNGGKYGLSGVLRKPTFLLYSGRACNTRGGVGARRSPAFYGCRDFGSFG